MTTNHGNQIKDDNMYETLREKGYSKEKAARIANAQSDPSQHPAEKGGHGKKYEKRTKHALYEKAKEIGIAGRSKMNKAELIDALRNHGF
ncbi:Rho termination factor N-terminal domain-containing protein [Alteromonas sp. C1M14]|uniref:Rho termination factor N-terminal domain-containing protein n=1 Tax=Alteromonas sp. C1M14 TaxID=2841567 RepID=UPI001C0943EB|nr:Rho termination factor N-terminal domain-containing protein [Alteromonas sp. C1M14]MBU2977200.1 Rho termination factor N-terminal domain-containing protein [Alteromonas sp. C1M14]